jgi:hypothetical protein
MVLDLNFGVWSIIFLDLLSQVFSQHEFTFFMLWRLSMAGYRALTGSTMHKVQDEPFSLAREDHVFAVRADQIPEGVL